MHATLTRRQLLYFAVIDVVLISLAWWWFAARSTPLPEDLRDFGLGGMTLGSPAFQEGSGIPQQYTCDGAGLTPPLTLGSVPAGAQSLVLVMEDPDAPLRTYTHWFVRNVTPQLGALEENALPPGAYLGPNGSQRAEYAPPCPPQGATHRYVFKAYALSTVPNLASETDLRTFLQTVEPDVIGRAALTATYRKK